MEWIEVRIATTREGVDLVGATLLENGITGFQVDDHEEMLDFLENNPQQWDYLDESLYTGRGQAPVITFYVSANPFGSEILLGVKSGLQALKDIADIPLGPLKMETSHKDDEEWLNNWKKYYKPFEIGRRIVIRPCWEDYENKEDKLVFTIDPGHVFGTGLHQTTRLCIGALEEAVKEDMKLLDLGCGSGILSVIGLMLGARKAVAVDIDANAVNIAYENADLNGVSREKYTVLSGNVLDEPTLQEEISRIQYDIVVANIVADVIIAMSPLAASVTKPGGIFISSGIIKERLAEVCEAVEKNDFVILNKVYQDDWVMVLSRKR